MKIDPLYAIVLLCLWLVSQAAWKISTEVGLIVTASLIAIVAVIYKLWADIGAKTPGQ